MGKCQFYSKYKEQLPPQIYEGVFGYPVDGLECPIGTPKGTDICVLHLPDPNKDANQVVQALISAMKEHSIGKDTQPLHYCFPKEFKFFDLIVAPKPYATGSRWALNFSKCIFFSNPFAGLEHLPGNPETCELRICLDGSIFAAPSIYLKPPRHTSEFLLMRCQFISIEMGGKQYPENVEPNLLIYGGPSNSQILLTGVKVAGYLHLNDISYPIKFGSHDPRYFGGDKIEVGNLTITGTISVPLVIRYVEVHQRLAIESAQFLKHVVFENIQNKSFVSNRAHFLSPEQSLIHGVNFSQALYYDTNILDIPLKEIRWSNKKIHYLIGDTIPVLFEEELKKKEKVDYPEFREKTWNELEDLYRSLKLNYQKQGNITAASNFYYREMYSRWKQRGKIGKLLHWESLYGHLSCWGSSVFRSVIVFLIYFMLWSFLYSQHTLFVITPFSELQHIDKCQNLMTAVTFSLENAFFLRPEFIKAKSWIGEAIKTTQIVLSAIQLFLITFTMRRKIKF